MQGRLRDLEGDRAWRFRRGLRRQVKEHGQSVRPQDPQQMGDAQASRNGVLPGGTRCPRFRRSAVDHEPSFRLPG